MNKKCVTCKFYWVNAESIQCKQCKNYDLHVTIDKDIGIFEDQK